MSETKEEKLAREEQEGKEAQATELKDKVASLLAKVEEQGAMLEEGKTARDQLLQELKSSKEFLSDPKFIEALDNRERQSGGSSLTRDEKLAAMSRAEFAEDIQKGLTDILTDAAKGMDKQMKEVRGELGNIYKMADIRFAKIAEPEFAKLLATEEGQEQYIAILEKNPTFSSMDIWDDIKKEVIVKEKEETDLKVAQAEEEKLTFSEKPVAAANIADEKDMTEDEVLGKIFDSTVGTQDQPLEEKAGVIVPMDD